jgi:hypothetical protein
MDGEEGYRLEKVQSNDLKYNRTIERSEVPFENY